MKVENEGRVIKKKKGDENTDIEAVDWDWDEGRRLKTRE